MATGKVFISHSAEDRADVYALVDFLESHGIATWIAPRDIQPGLDYSESTQDAIEQCAAFVVVVTDAANQSRFVRAETEMAFSGKRPIFPVRFREIAPGRGLALFLKICHWTDAFGPQAAYDRQRLASALIAASGPAADLGAAAPQPSLPEPEPEPVAAPLPQEADPPDPPAEPAVVLSLGGRKPFLLVARPRTAVAAGMAFVLALSAWPLFGNRGAVPGDAPPAIDAAGTSGGGEVAVRPALPPRPAPKAEGPPTARSVPPPIAAGRARPATSQAARRPAPATASSQRSSPPAPMPRRGTTVRVRGQQMPCREVTVANGKSTDRNRVCTGAGGLVVFG